MGARRIVGLVLVIFGIVVLAWGGVFWTERDTVIDAGPLQVQTEQQEGFALPPLVGIAAVIGGIVMLAIPERRR
jgi:multidrug transporter EmrE-like cation transporter